MAAHRFIRISITNNYGGNYTGFQYIALAETDGVNRATVAANASASSSIGGQVASNAIVGQPGQWANTGGSTAYWQYDFGPGNAYDITQITITARSENGTYDPQSFDALVGDNGTDWITSWSENDTAAAPAVNEIRTYASTVLPPYVMPPGGHQYWRIRIRQNYGGEFAGFGYIQFAAADGVNKVTNNAGASASSNYSGQAAGNAVIGQAGQWATAAGQWSPNSSPATYWAYDFGARGGINVDIVTITCRSEDAAYEPRQLDLQWADTLNAPDANWTTKWAVNDPRPAPALREVRQYPLGASNARVAPQVFFLA